MAALLRLHLLPPGLLHPAAGDLCGASRNQQVRPLLPGLAAATAARRRRRRVLPSRHRCLTKFSALHGMMSQPASAAWRAACGWAPSDRQLERLTQLRGLPSQTVRAECRRSLASCSVCAACATAAPPLGRPASSTHHATALHLPLAAVNGMSTSCCITYQCHQPIGAFACASCGAVGLSAPQTMRSSDQCLSTNQHGGQSVQRAVRIAS